VTAAALVFPAVFVLVAAVAQRAAAVVSDLALFVVEPVPAASPVVLAVAPAVFVLVAVVAQPAVAVVSDLALFVVEPALAASPVVLAVAPAVFVLVAAVAQRAVALVSDLALIFFESGLAAVLVFVLAFHADRAFALPAAVADMVPMTSAIATRSKVLIFMVLLLVTRTRNLT
jgi:hypothetical protein